MGFDGKRWKGMILAGMTVVLIGSMTAPMALRATEPSVIETDNTGTGQSTPGAITGEGNPGSDTQQPSENQPSATNPATDPDQPTGDNPATDPDQPTGDNPATDPDQPTGDNPATDPDQPTGDNPAADPDQPTGDNPATDPTPGTSTEEEPPETPDESTVANAIVRVRIDGVDTEYADMKEAWAAVNGRTAELTLLGDVTTAAAMNTAFVLTSGDVTLDLGGHKWTYQYASSETNKPATFDLIEIKGDASLTVKGSSGSEMVYAGSSTYKGACLYATGNATLTIEGGTFSSNVSAPIYVDGATLNIKGGIFKAAGADESAITMNNGTFNMTGGEVQFGKLTLNNINGSQEVGIGGDSTLSGVETKGQNALPITDTLSPGYQYENQSNAANKVTASTTAGQTGEKISNVVTRASIGLKIEADPADKHDVSFSYTGEETIRLTASYDDQTNPNVKDMQYSWKVIYPGESAERDLNHDTATYTFSSKYNAGDADKIKAGTYTYIVKATYTTESTGSGDDSDTEGGGTGTEGGSGEGGGTGTEGGSGEGGDTNTGDGSEDGGDTDTEDGSGDDSNADAGDGSGNDSGTGAVQRSGSETAEARYEINVLPIENGTVTKKAGNSYGDSYVYDEAGVPSPRGGEEFDVDSYVPEDVKRNLTWTYTWYAGTTRLNGKPVDVGNYTLEVTARDGANYTATGTFPVEITQESVTPRIANTPTKIYDGSTALDAKEVEIELIKSSDGSKVSYSANELLIGSCTYDTADVGDNKRITVTGISWNESSGKSKNYRLTSDECQGTGSITRASLILEISADPETPEINKPVTITVTVLNDDTNRSPNNALTADNIRLNVSRGEEAAPVLRSAGNGVFTGEYTTATAGDRSFSVEVTGSSNYDIKNPASVTVTFIEVVPQSAISITVNKESIVYGDDATFTATVTKVDGQDGDALNGGVQFYLDGEDSTNKIGTAQSIKVSGDKATVTLSRSQLSAGDHKLMAQFTSDNAEGSKAEGTVKVEKKPLTWNTSGLTASKTEGKSDEVTVYGTLSVDGVLDGEVKFVQPEAMKTNGFKNTEAGTYTVSVVPESGDWTFDPQEPENYELPGEDPQIKAKVNALKELSNPPEARDGNTYRLVMEEGLSEVPDGLKNTSFNTPSKIEDELKRILTSTGSFSAENIAVYDVKLQVTTDDGKTWEDANADNFPEEGVKVTLPYPGGTGRYTHNFAVAHMFGESLFGHTSGTVEVPSVTKVDNGLEFTVTGLSPIAVAWTDISNAATSPVGTAIRRLLGVQTGDESPIVLYAGMAGACVLILVIFVVVFAVRRKKK